MKNLQDLRIFIHTTRVGSLSECARQMDLSPAVVSAAIKRLEKDLDTLLFIRSTRHLRLTDKGTQFLQYCNEAVTLLDNGFASLRGHKGELSGILRLSAPSDLGRNQLLYWLDEFMARYPKVSLQLHADDGYADLYAQNIDMALRYGTPKDSSLVAVPISLNSRPVVCASPDYLAEFGKPLTPDELNEHNCLCMKLNEKYYNRWVFIKENEKKVIEVTGNRRSKDGEIVRRWALAGKGIAWKSKLDVMDDLHTRRLVEIDFGDWQSPIYPLYLISPERRMIDPLFRALRDFLVEQTQQVLGNTR